MRNADLNDLAQLLQEQQSRKVDLIVAAEGVRSENGVLVVAGADPEHVLTDDGVTTLPRDGRYLPTASADSQIAESLGIGTKYLRKLREQRPDLYDANVNGWLHGNAAVPAEPDSRRFLLRAFKADSDAEQPIAGMPPGTGIARSLNSDTYLRIDHLDVLTAALSGVKDTGTPVQIDGCDLTDRRMFVRVSCPEIQVLAPQLLAGYRAPWDGTEAHWNGRYVPNVDDKPVVFAGFVIANSETGHGRFTITPRITYRICSNGQTFSADALGRTHLGSQIEGDGIVKWSADTQATILALVQKQARDAVSTFLDTAYVQAKVDQLTAAAGHKLTDPAEAVESVAKSLSFGKEVTAGILGHFISGGQPTAGGLMQAVTSYAQTLTDGDAAADMEAAAEKVLHLAARL